MRPIERAAAFFAVLIWGLNLVVGKIGVTAAPPLALMTLRFAIVTLLLLPFLRRPSRSWRLVGGLAVVFTAHFGLLFVGLRGVDAAHAAVAIQLAVPFSAGLAALLYKERLGVWQLCGMGISFGGVWLLAGEPQQRVALPHLMMLVVASLGWATTTVLLRRLGHVSPLVLSAWIASFATPLLALASALLESGQWGSIFQPDWRVWGSALYMAIGSSIIAYSLWYWLLGRYEVSRLVPLTLFSPVLGVAFAVVLLGETITPRLIGGGLVTMLGVSMIQLLRPRAATGT